MFTAVKIAEASQDIQCAADEGDESQAEVTGTQLRSVEPNHTSTDGTRIAKYVS